MLNIDEINSEILMLETRRDTTYSVVEKLAPLYIVRDHLNGEPSQQPQPLEVDGGSEFLSAVAGKDSREVFGVVDEIMQTISVINPRLYAAAMKKIGEIA